MNRRSFLARAALAGAAAPFAGCVGGATRPDDARFTALRDRYFMRFLELNPVTCTYVGGDGYTPVLQGATARLRDYSSGALASELAFYRESRVALDTIEPARLSRPLAVDLDVMRAQLDYVLHVVGELRWHERAVDSYLSEIFRGAQWSMEQMTPLGGGRSGDGGEWTRLMSRLSAVPEYLDAAGEALARGMKDGNVPDRRMVERDGFGRIAPTASYLRGLANDAAPLVGDRPGAAAILAALGSAGDAAAKAVERFGDRLRDLYGSLDATDRYAVGEAIYAWRVRTALAETRSTAELWAWGDQLVASYEEELFRVAPVVADALGLKLSFTGGEPERWASLRKVVDALSTDYPKSDDEVLEWFRDTVWRAVDYGRGLGLFDVPANYDLPVLQTPGAIMASGGGAGASYYPAPAFKKVGTGHFFVDPTGNDPAKLSTYYFRASIADTAVHEGFPGHDWNYRVMNLHAREISNLRWLTPGAVEDSLSMWGDSAATEGWALFAEELMAEPADGKPYGFYSPAEYVYELQGQLLRAARVRIDVGIHTGRMSWDEAVDYYAHHADFYPGARQRQGADPAAKAVMEDAEGAIYRYSKWPTQAISYMLGKTSIAKLRQDTRARLGGQFHPQRFYEHLMKQGPIPVGRFHDSFLAKFPPPPRQHAW